MRVWAMILVLSECYALPTPPPPPDDAGTDAGTEVLPEGWHGPKTLLLNDPAEFLDRPTCMWGQLLMYGVQPPDDAGTTFLAGTCKCPSNCSAAWCELKGKIYSDTACTQQETPIVLGWPNSGCNGFDSQNAPDASVQSFRLDSTAYVPSCFVATSYCPGAICYKTGGPSEPWKQTAKLCELGPPHENDGPLCVWKEFNDGQAPSCPSSYPDGSVFYHTIDDQRVCPACGCTATCSGTPTVNVYGDRQCSATSATSLSDTSCVAASGEISIDHKQADSCSVHDGGAISGHVTVSDPFIVCCKQSP